MILLTFEVRVVGSRHLVASCFSELCRKHGCMQGAGRDNSVPWNFVQISCSSSFEIRPAGAQQQRSELSQCPLGTLRSNQAPPRCVCC